MPGFQSGWDKSGNNHGSKFFGKMLFKRKTGNSLIIICNLHNPLVFLTDRNSYRHQNALWCIWV